MSSTHAEAIASVPHPVAVGRSLKPNPGSEGATTWKAGAPRSLGSASASMMSTNSATLPGQPWVMTSGTASGRGER